MGTPNMGQPRPLARIIGLTIYPPGEKPHHYGEQEIQATGLQDGTTVAVVVDKDGQQIEWYGMPIKVTKAQTSSGLVAPSGPLLVPPTS